MAGDIDHGAFDDDLDDGPAEQDEQLDRLSELEDKVDGLATTVEGLSRHAVALDRSGTLIFAVMLLTIVAGLILAYFVDEALYPRIAIYPAVRQADGTLKPLNKTIYKVNLVAETVTCWTPGKYDTPYRFENSAIRDKKNWVAYYRLTGVAVVEMQKGKLVKQNLPALQDPNEIYIDRFHWWRLRLGMAQR